MCCVAECGICGGDGCRKRAEAAFLTPEDCCATNIEASGVYCDDSQSAPCIIDSGGEGFGLTMSIATHRLLCQFFKL